MIVRAMIVGAMIVASTDCRSMIVGEMIVGTMIVGEMRLQCMNYTVLNVQFYIGLRSHGILEKGSWKVMEKSWNFISRCLWEPCLMLTF